MVWISNQSILEMANQFHFGVACGVAESLSLFSQSSNHLQKIMASLFTRQHKQPAFILSFISPSTEAYNLVHQMFNVDAEYN
jgi:hypothetical protein